MPFGTPVFDWVATALAAVFLGGLFLDGWAHTHGRVDETFLTPWHAVLYSGYLALAGLLAGRAGWGINREHSWRTALPDGYGLALAGAGLWVIGGPFDAAWHTVFGFEANIEALMSPAHTVLALGFALMASGPLRAGLRRPAGPWRDELPMVLSLTFLICLLTFFTQVAHPLANLWGAGSDAESATVTELGIVSVLLTAAIIVAPVLLLLRHGRLPVGSVAILVTLNSAGMGFLYHQGAYPLAAVVAVAAGGCGADLLRVWLQPTTLRPAAFRAWAFALPTFLQLGYFGALHVSAGIAWSVHLWTGAVVFAGVVGWLLSYLALPPRIQGD